MSDKNLSDEFSDELSDDIEVIGPGQMLADAREKLGFTQEYVAQRLNFKHSLVIDIEHERFDKSLPATYNRGYLKNYAKLVNLSCEDILSSYEMLGVAQTQSAEMQSFSKITEKQAHNNRLMWISYLILAIIIGTTVMWFVQEKQNINANLDIFTTKQSNEAKKNEQVNAAENSNEAAVEELSANSVAEEAQSEAQTLETPVSSVEESLIDSPAQASVLPTNGINDEIAAADVNTLAQIATVEAPMLADVVFTFSGDCWVNIYDAKGERIAWGVKRTGYEMNISALAPLTVTLGKPELVEISYNSEAIDMSQFNTGNIAKFILPIAAN